MRILRNYACSSCGNKFEILTPNNECEVKCACGWLAHKVMTAPRYFGATTGRSSSLNYKRVK